jgi:hypothetical protein
MVKESRLSHVGIFSVSSEQARALETLASSRGDRPARPTGLQLSGYGSELQSDRGKIGQRLR